MRLTGRWLSKYNSGEWALLGLAASEKGKAFLEAMVSPSLQLCPQRIYGLRVARRGPGSLLVVSQKVYNLREDEYRKIAIGIKLALGGDRLHEIVVYPELGWHQSLFSDYEGRPDV